MLTVEPTTEAPPSAVALSLLLESARRAPSADNSQPWRIALHEGALALALDADRARSGHLGHAMACLTLGGVLESLDLTARSLGMRAVVRARSRELVVVRVVPAQASSTDLAPAIALRATNRSPFDGAPLPAAQLDALAAEGVAMTSEAPRVAQVADAAALAERVRFAAEPMADLQRWLRFSAAEAERTKDGLDLRLLALDASERLALRMCGTRTGVNALRFLGGPALAARRGRAEISAAGGVGMIAQKGLDDDDFVASGRIMLRVWLRATQLGLAFAPTCAAVFLPLSRQLGARFGRTDDAMLDTATRAVRAAFDVPRLHHPVFLFRVGHAAQVPTVRSERREVGT